LNNKAKWVALLGGPFFSVTLSVIWQRQPLLTVTIVNIITILEDGMFYVYPAENIK